MQFKCWLENRITRDEARNIVLDAVGAGNSTDEEKQTVLGSKISEQPKLAQNIQKYSEIRLYLNQILSFIRMNQNANLIGLINYIEKVDTAI